MPVSERQVFYFFSHLWPLDFILIHKIAYEYMAGKKQWNCLWGPRELQGGKGLKKEGRGVMGTMCNVRSKVYYHVLCNTAPCTTTIQICNKNKQQINNKLEKKFVLLVTSTVFFFFIVSKTHLESGQMAQHIRACASLVGCWSHSVLSTHM